MATVSFTTPGPTPIALQLRQFDADEYMAMAEADVFAGRSRVELIEGYIVEMSPANPDHNYVIMRLNVLFMPLADQYHLWVQGTLSINKQNVFDPDFMLLRPREESYKLTLPAPEDVALVIEVAGSSLGRDAQVKLPIYAAHGIAEYWIADLDRETLIVHRQPMGGAYLEAKEYAGNAKIASLAAPDHFVKAKEIFE